MQRDGRGLAALLTLALFGAAGCSSTGLPGSSVAGMSTVLTAYRCLFVPSSCVWAWGYNGSGELGNNATASSNVPILVHGLTSVIGVAGGSVHSVALESDGTAWAWGDNQFGQLGNGENVGTLVPVNVGPTSIAAVAAGFYHSMALRSDGTVWTWGDNRRGQLGNGSSVQSSNVAVQVSGLVDVVAIAAGGGHSLALKADGTVWAWGYNGLGQLGNGTNQSSDRPVEVVSGETGAPLTGISAIAAGDVHSLALRKQDGAVLAWGHNFYGQLGSTVLASNRPLTVSDLAGVGAIAAGQNHSLALQPDGTVWTWGSNQFGQLGIGTTGGISNSRVEIAGFAALAIAAGDGNHSLARRADGTLWAWGYNRDGQLGNALNQDSSTPVQVAALGGAVAVAGGGQHSLAIVGARPTAAQVTAQIAALQLAGCIDDPAMASALIENLGHAQARIAAGEPRLAAERLRAVLESIRAETGVHIATSCGDASFSIAPAALLYDRVQALRADVASGGTAIVGYVVGASGTGRSGVAVDLLDGKNAVVLTATTDSSGLYWFDNTNALSTGAAYVVRPTRPATPPTQAFTWMRAPVTLENFALGR